jgi:hypothetical protein
LSNEANHAAFQVRSGADVPPVPKFFKKGLANMGGMNPMGEPNLRVVHGTQRRGWRNGEANAILYMNLRNAHYGWNCWILEAWAAPEFFNEREWALRRYGPDVNGTGKMVDYLGPFPRRGDYIFIQHLINAEGEALPLTEPVLAEIASHITRDGMAVIAAMETRRRREQCEKREALAKQLDDLQEYYNQSGERINQMASRRYNQPPLAYTNTDAVKRAANILIPGATTPSSTGKETPCPQSS